jgi:hypothetical protein
VSSCECPRLEQGRWSQFPGVRDLIPFPGFDKYALEDGALRALRLS